MNRTIIKGIVFSFIFIISAFIISGIMNKGNTDMTAEMGKATYPLVSIDLGGERVNYLRGYKNPMDIAYNKEIITPIDTERKLSITIDTKGMGLDSIHFEIRSLNGERLIEHTEIVDYIDEAGVIETTIIIKDLIELQEEYNLVLILKSDNSEELRYYTRIIQMEDNNVDEIIRFAKSFTERTFDKEKAESLIKHLETKPNTDNTSLGKVDIYSNFHQITWGDLKVEMIGSVDATITKIVGDTADVELDYYVEEKCTAKRYRINEYYSIRWISEEQIYILGYERVMNQVLDFSEKSFTGKYVSLGIMNEEVELIESDGGTVVSFVYDNQLFAYNKSEKEAVCLFSFFNNDNNDKRSTYRGHDIKILNIDETGNIRFMVYGYINRGNREGELGFQVYMYNGEVNTIEEEIFIPYEKSIQLLEYEVEQLSYVSKNNILYLLVENTIYSIDLVRKTSDAIVTNLVEEKFVVSDSNETIAWQVGNDIYDSSELILMNLNTKEQKIIKAGNGKRIEPLGFMDEDLIYGVADKDDIIIDQAGRTIFPMNEIRIESEAGDLEKVYKQEGFYVEACEIEENQIILKRLMKEGEAYVSASDDHILNSKIKKENYYQIDTVVVDTYQEIQQIDLGGNSGDDTIKYLTPKEVMYEGDRSLSLDYTDSKRINYYVYHKDGIGSIYADPAKAINLAKEESGAVLNGEGSYIWESTNKRKSNQIMSINDSSIGEGKNSIAICLDSIFKYEGISRNSEYMLNKGETVIQILAENLVDYQVLDLSQCSLDAVLYYVGKEIPVLAMLDENKSVLIIGYNETDVVLMDPLRSPELGRIYKQNKIDAKKVFEKNGNSFIAYIPDVE